LPPNEQRSGLGRRLAVGIYSIALAYLVIVGFVSVIPQVFWPDSDDSFNPECTDGLKMLRNEVDRLRLSYLASNETDPTALRNALDSWDLRLSALARRCDEDQVHLLNRYRHRVELSLQRSMREDAPIAKRVTEAIEPTLDVPVLDKSGPVR
jgi:hypothetical protein